MTLGPGKQLTHARHARVLGALAPRFHPLANLAFCQPRGRHCMAVRMLEAARMGGLQAPFIDAQQRLRRLNCRRSFTNHIDDHLWL